MSDKPDEIIASPLAAHIPPMELDHRAALELLYQQQIRAMSPADFDKMVLGYREVRRQEAAKRLERDRKRALSTAKKAETEAKRKAKAAAKAPDQAQTQSGGEGNSNGPG